MSHADVTCVLCAQVGWDESALDMEDLRLKSIYDKAMSTHAVNKKAAEAARDIVAALEGRKVQPPQPSLQVITLDDPESP